MSDIIEQTDLNDFTEQFLQLFRAAAPERSKELDALLDGEKNLILRGSDQVGFLMESNRWFIRFTDRSLEAVRALAVTGAHAVEVYSGAIWAARVGLLDLSDIESADPNESAYVAALRHNISEAIECLNSQDVLQCKAVRPINSGKMFELLAGDCIELAVAFVFLHELKHRIEEPLDTEELEERRADEFALNWLLGSAHIYAQECGHEIGKVVAKRGMGIALAMFVIASLTSLRNGDGDPHPPPADRLRKLLETVSATSPGDTFFWDIAASVIVGVLRTKDIQIVVDAKGLTDEELTIRLLSLLSEAALS